jgi:hypothetical protein
MIAMDTTREPAVSPSFAIITYLDCGDVISLGPLGSTPWNTLTSLHHRLPNAATDCQLWNSRLNLLPAVDDIIVSSTSQQLPIRPPLESTHLALAWIR